MCKVVFDSYGWKTTKASSKNGGAFKTGTYTDVQLDIALQCEEISLYVLAKRVINNI